MTTLSSQFDAAMRVQTRAKIIKRNTFRREEKGRLPTWHAHHARAQVGRLS